MSQSRRTFIQHASVATAGLLGSSLLDRKWNPMLTPNQIIGNTTPDPEEMRTIALKALDVAKSAGARYADVRVLQGHYFYVKVLDGTVYRFDVGRNASFGIRALVDSCWGFSGGSLDKPGIVEKLSRLAVARSRGNERLHPRKFDLTPVPIEKDGFWEMPIEQNGLDVPIGEHEAIYAAATAEALKVKGVRTASLTVAWVQMDHVFASTDGVMLRQKHFRAVPGEAGPTAFNKDNTFFVDQYANVQWGGVGFECVSKWCNLKDEYRKAAEEAARIAAMPLKAAEIGRSDVVFSPEAMAPLVWGVAGASWRGGSLDLECALGQKPLWGGTFAKPPLDILGKYQLGSKLVTIKADRSRPKAVSTLKWDEEGAPTHEYTLVKDGIITDFITNRETALKIAPWYEKTGQPLRSHAAMSNTGIHEPNLVGVNYTLEPSKTPMSSADLMKEMKKGYYISQGQAWPDSNTRLNVQVFGTLAFEVVNGKPVAVVQNCALETTTVQLFKGIAAIGDAQSAKLESIQIDGPRFGPETHSHVSVCTPPAMTRNMTIINAGSTFNIRKGY